MQDEACLFCKIAEKRIPAHIIYEDDRTIGFLDIAPRATGHSVIISKYHSPTLLDLPDEELTPLFQSVKKIGKRIIKTLIADGLTIGINQGIVSGQTVEHLHVHIIPRFRGDHGGSVHSVVNQPSSTPLSEVAQKLRQD